MKKIFYTLLLALLPTAAWAVNVQTYTDPSQLPEAFTWNMTRYDYYATDPNAEQVLVNTQDVVVKWDPTYRNSSGSYGKLEIQNFYKHSKTSVCNLTFDNTGTHNFEWNGDACAFSLNSYYYSYVSSSTGTGNATLHYAFINSAAYDKNSSTYWVKPSYVTSTAAYPKTNYKYGGSTALSFRLDISEKSIVIENSAWGAFMCYTNSGGAPSYVLDYYVRSDFVCTDTDLVDIVRDNEEGDEVTVADDLLAVGLLTQYSYDNSGNKTPVGAVLLAKDMGKYESPDVNTAGAYDYMMSSGTFTREYDQSNWVVLTGEQYLSGGMAGHIIKGGTIKGTFTDKLNPTIALSQAPTMGEVQDYAPNYYIVPSFSDSYVGSEDVFFVQPKPQEYCMVQWANYDAATDAFYVPAQEGRANSMNLSGGFAWDKTYLEAGSAEDQTVYTFPAIVNKVPAASQTYNVWLHVIDSNNGNALLEDGQTYLYAYKDDQPLLDAWPGKRLTAMRKATDGTTASNWYYLSLGTTRPDGIVITRGGDDTKTGNITALQLGDNFINYYPYGDWERYSIASGFSPASNGPRRETARPKVDSGVSSRYVVMPMQLNSESVITAIADRQVAKTVTSVTYYSVMGVPSARPHNGVNIVVTRYTDGTMSSRGQCF